MARGVALLGMITVHVLPELDASGHITVAFLLFSGRAAALFALLAGVGLALATGGERPRLQPRQAVAAKVLTRALLVAFIGLALGTLNTPVEVILTNYGLLFAVALIFIALRSRTLLILATGWVVVTPILSQALRAHLPVNDMPDPSFAQLLHPRGLLVRLVLIGTYPVLQWTAYLLVGLAVGRLPLRRASTAVTLAISGLALTVFSRVSSDLLVAQGFSALRHAGAGQTREIMQMQSSDGVPPPTTWWWQAVAAPHTATPFDLAQTIGSALLVLGLALLLGSWLEREASRWLVLVRAPFVVLAAAGSMTLTLYTLHVLALNLQLAPDADGDGAMLLLHLSAALVLAGLWRSFAARGPLEAIVAYAARRAAAFAAQSTQPTDFPHANRPARPWFKKRRFVLPGIALAVITIASACSAGGSKSNPTGVSHQAQPATPAAAGYSDYGAFVTVSKSGRGSMTIAVPAGGDAGIVIATHRGSSHFVVRGLDSVNQPTIDGSLVNEIGNYSGTTAYGLTAASVTPDKLQITTVGAWRITIAAISTAPMLPDSASGKSDSVFRYNGDDAHVAITHKGSSKFMVEQYGDNPAKGVNQIGNYSGTVPLVAGPSVVVVSAGSTWTLKQ